MLMRASSGAPLAAFTTANSMRPGALRSAKLAGLGAAGHDRDRGRAAARVVAAGGVERIVARGKAHLVGAILSEHPAVGLAALFDHDDGCGERPAIGAAHAAAHHAGGQPALLDLGRDHGREIAAGPDLQPAGEGAALPRVEGMQQEQVTRVVGDLVHVRSMQRHGPGGVVAAHSPGESAVGPARAQAGKAGHREQEPAARPERQTGEQVR